MQKLISLMLCNETVFQDTNRLICHFAIKVYHLLNHTSGLHNALGDVVKTDPMSVCDWEEMLDQIAKSTPETEPGSSQIYHYLSFGWLCGGLIEV